MHLLQEVNRQREGELYHLAVKQDQRKRGVATLLCREMTRIAREELHVQKLKAGPLNTALVSVMEFVGFKRSGLIQAHHKLVLQGANREKE